MALNIPARLVLASDLAAGFHLAQSGADLVNQARVVELDRGLCDIAGTSQPAETTKNAPSCPE